MKTITKLLGVALVGVLTVSGVAAATGGVGVVADTQTNDDVDRPLDGSNSPWATEDERLEVFQDRFNLTDEQVDEIQTAVQSDLDADASREEIRETVQEKLEAFGVEDPTLGPTDDRAGAGSQYRDDDDRAHAGYGPGNGAGYGQGSGPHGPADGSCMT